MRFKLLRRRLTISAPRVAVRSAMPWPLRWVVAAIVLGFCAAIGLWAFEFGKGIAGLDTGARDELVSLREEVARLRRERDQAQSVANTAGSLLATEKSAQERLVVQLKRMEAENLELRDNLGFYEKLLPTGVSDAIVIRGLQAEALANAQIKWQVLVVLPARSATDFSGTLAVIFEGLLDGKPWSMTLPGGAQPLQVRQFRRMEGVVDLPPHAVVKAVSAKVIAGDVVRAVQTVKLQARAGY